MKLTKSKLKQLIREALRETHAGEEAASGDKFDQQHPEIDALMSDAQELYASLPDEGKRALTQNFETYFNKWEEELEGAPEEEEEEGVSAPSAPSTEYTSPNFRPARMQSGHYQGKN